jgi:hypothetical protein
MVKKCSKVKPLESSSFKDPTLKGPLKLGFNKSQFGAIISTSCLKGLFTEQLDIVVKRLVQKVIKL